MKRDRIVSAAIGALVTLAIMSIGLISTIDTNLNELSVSTKKTLENAERLESVISNDRLNTFKIDEFRNSFEEFKDEYKFSKASDNATLDRMEALLIRINNDLTIKTK